MRNCLITEEQLNFLLDNGAACIKEEKGGIDRRMKVLAELIYDKSLEYSAENKTSFIISAQDLNRFQDYIVFSAPLRIVLAFLKNNASATFSFFKNENTIILDPARYKGKNYDIPVIIHELTHMIRYNKTKESSILRIQSSDERSLTVNKYLYYFNTNEMQARISQYYYFCQYNNIVPPSSANVSSITNLHKIQQSIDELRKDPILAFLFSCAIRKTFKKGPMNGKDFLKKGYSSLLSYVEKRYKIYYKKLMKIYNYFSNQNLS